MCLVFRALHTVYDETFPRFRQPSTLSLLLVLLLSRAAQIFLQTFGNRLHVKIQSALARLRFVCLAMRLMIQLL